MIFKTASEIKTALDAAESGDTEEVEKDWSEKELLLYSLILASGV